MPATDVVRACSGSFGILETVVESKGADAGHEVWQSVEEPRSELWPREGHVRQGRILVMGHVTQILVEIVHRPCLCFRIANTREERQGCFSWKESPVFSKALGRVICHPQICLGAEVDASQHSYKVDHIDVCLLAE